MATLSINDVSINEDGTQASLTVTLNNPSGNASVQWATANGTAVSGTDYSTSSGTVNLSIATPTATINVPIMNDSLKESNETFFVILSSPTGATISDGSGLVTIIDNDADKLLRPIDRFIEGGAAEHGGNSKTAVSTPSGVGLQYNSHSNGKVILDLRTRQPVDSAVPSQIKAELTFNGSLNRTIDYDTTGLTAGANQRFVFEVDASALPSGTYDWSLLLTETIGSNHSFRTLSGVVTVLNRSNSEYGKPWRLSGHDELAISTNWVSVLFSDGSTAYYYRPDIQSSGGGGGGLGGGGGATSEGLKENADHTFTYTYRDGSKVDFNALGKITQRRDRNQNRTTYTYDGSQRLTTITYQTGRTVTVSYNASGKLQSIADWAGRVSTVTIDGSGYLTSFTNPDPDAGGPLTAPTTNFAYYTSSHGLLKDVQNARGYTTTFEYDQYARVSKLIKPGSANYVISPQIVQGLVPSGSGTAGSPVPLPNANPSGTITDPLSNVSTYQFDHLGFVLSFSNALGNTTTFERNEAGYITKQTHPDPDGPGPLTAPIILVEYDANNNVTKKTNADGNFWTAAYDATWNQPTEIIDVLGRKTIHTVQSTTGNITQVRRVVGQVDDPMLNGETDDQVYSYTYTSNPTASGQLPGGLVLSSTDATGTVNVFSYGSSPGQNNFGRLISQTYAQGTADAATYSFTYDSAGNNTTITDPLGYITTLGYDLLGRVTHAIYPDPDGIGPLTSPITYQEFDSNNNLLRQIDAFGNITSYAYDHRDRLTSITYPDPDGAGPLSPPIHSIGYDAASRMTTMTDALGNTTSFAYNAASQNTQITYADPDGAGPLSSPVVTMAYDAMGRLTSKTDPLSRVTSYVYDVASRVTSKILPDQDGAGPLGSPVYQATYNAAGLMVTTTNPSGAVTTYSYDALNRLSQITYADPDGAGPLGSATESYTYTKDDQVYSFTDTRNATTFFAYDNIGRNTGATLPDPDGAGPLVAPTIQRTFDPAGRVTGTKNAANQWTSYYYDNLGQVTLISYPDPDGGGPVPPPIDTFTYDAAGRLLSRTDSLGNVYSWLYDNLGRKIQSLEPDPDGAGPLTSPTTTYKYNANGRLTTLIDPSGNTTTWAFDALGRTISETNPLNKTKSWVYDAAGRTTTVTDRLNRTIEYTYDNLDNTLTEVWKTNGSTVRTMSFTYDTLSNLLTASDPTSTHTYAYDALSRLTQETVDYGPTVADFKLQYSYNTAGDMTNMALSRKPSSTWLADLQNNYVFGPTGRLDSITQQGQAGGATVAPKHVAFTYTADGSFSTLARYRSTSAVPANLVSTSTFGYDFLSRLTSLTHDKIGTTQASYSWTLDRLSRITQQVLTASVGASDTANFSYDTRGQLTSVTHTGMSNETYSFDASGNRTNSGYTTGTGNRLTSDGVFHYTYNNEGALVTRTRISGAPAPDKTTSFSWDHRNRLTRIQFRNNAGVVTKQLDYTYDVFNRRASKLVDPDGPGGSPAVRTRYIYQGNNIVASTNAAGVVQHRFLHGPAVDQVLAAEDALSGDILWALTDHLGSVRDVVNDSGTVTNHVLFDSFGNVVSETNSAVDFLFGFTGRERDEESELNYHRARYYNPGTGRWISEDPIGFAGGDYNIHRYVNNNPVNRRDPTGLYDDQGVNAPGANVQFWHLSNVSLFGDEPTTTDISDAKTFLDLADRVKQYSGVDEDPGLVISAGCVGLAAARLGIREVTDRRTPRFPFAERQARFFATIEDARRWQRENTPRENPTEFTTLAIQVPERLSTPRLGGAPGRNNQIDPTALFRYLEDKDDYNFATDLDDDLSREAWEYMNHEFPVVRGPDGRFIPDISRIDRNDVPVVVVSESLPDHETTVFVVLRRKRIR